MASYAGEEPRIDIGRVVQGGFQAIGRRLPAYLLLAVLLGGVPAFLTQYSILSIEGAEDAQTLWFMSGAGIAGALIAMIAGAVLQVAVVRCAILDLGGRGCDVAESLVEGLKLILPLIGLTILTGIAVVIGLVLLIVPGIIVYLALSVSVPVLVEERRGVIGSMERSAELTKGSRWRIFGLMLLYLIAYALIASAIGASSMVFGAPETPLALALIEAVIGTFTGLLIAGMLASLYVELRTVKEGASFETLASVFD